MAENYWTAKSTSRRKLLGGTVAAGAGALGLTLVGCGDDGKGPSSTAPSGFFNTPTPQQAAASATAQVKRGGTQKVHILLAADDVWDPHLSLTSAGLIWQMIGNQAVHLKPDGSGLVPELVEKWQIPGDGTEIILTIRNDVNWHNKPPSNGRKFTTDDLAFNINRITGLLNPDKVGLYSRRSTLPNLEKATPIDDSTVRVKLTAPHSGFLTGLADFRNNLAPRDFVEKSLDSFADATKLVGTGAWTIDTWNISTKAVMKAVPNWDKGKPYLDAVEMYQYSDRLAYQTAFGKGDLDTFYGPNKAERESLKKLTDNYREERWVSNLWSHFRFNLAAPPFNDERVRRAVFLALDYQAYMDAFHGAGYWEWSGPLTGFGESMPPAEVAKLPGYNPATKDADRKTANDLLAAAGMPKGAGLSFKFLPSTQITTAQPFDAVVRAQDDLKRVFPDLKVEIDPPKDAPAFASRQVAGQFDVISYTIGGFPDAVIEMEAHYDSKGSRNYGKFSDAEVDSAIAKATSELDAGKRRQLLLDAQKKLIDKMPMVRYAANTSTVYYGKQIKGGTGYGLVTGTGAYDMYFNRKNEWIDKG